MSKIYQALEKAERERGQSLENGSSSPLERGPNFEEIREAIPEPERTEMVACIPNLVTCTQPESLSAEQFRKLRTYLLRHKILESHRVIMVTSALNGEGKTMISANLAAGIARDMNAHALLIDCDLRNPSLTDLFGLPKRKGLSDYLNGDGVVSDLILRTGVGKLSILPAGSQDGNPTELMASKKMESLIRELKQQYTDRYIILDATPILATTEPEVLCRAVDGIILVVRAGSTPRETIQQALKPLDKEKIIGVVLNDLVFKSPILHSRYFGSEGYYYKYGYRRRNRLKEKWWQRVLRKGQRR